jgi:hypothetical protein
MTAYVQVTAATQLVAELVGEDAVVVALVNLVSPSFHFIYLLNDPIDHRHGGAVSLSSPRPRNMPTERTLRLWCKSHSCFLHQWFKSLEKCQDGYSKSQDGTQCVCPAPKIECNGICQTQACSSSVPQGPAKRDMSGMTLRSRMRFLTQERCPAGHVLCGAGASRRRHDAEWECIDTRSTLDSCRSCHIISISALTKVFPGGGCMYPFLLDERPVTGIDCTSLPGVSGVQCHAGRCLVHRCKRGWSIASSGSGCVADGGFYNSNL